MQDSCRRPLIDVVPCMEKLASDTTFPWVDWCKFVCEGLRLFCVPTCFVHSPHEILRLAWASAFRVPSDDLQTSYFYDKYSDTVVDCILITFPFMSDYSCAWFIDRLYRYMGRNDIEVKQIACDETCLIHLAPTVSDTTLSKIFTDVVMGNAEAAHLLEKWLRSCLLCAGVPNQLKLIVNVSAHMDEQTHCQSEECAQKMCTSLAQTMRKKSIKIRTTPVIDNGLPAYALNFFVQN